MEHIQLAVENGVYYTMEVKPVVHEDGYIDGYNCRGYALANGIKLTEWNYFALDETEAHEQLTKDYLLRELRPQVKNAFKLLSLIITRNLESN